MVAAVLDPWPTSRYHVLVSLQYYVVYAARSRSAEAPRAACITALACDVVQPGLLKAQVCGGSSLVLIVALASRMGVISMMQ